MFVEVSCSAVSLILNVVFRVCSEGMYIDPLAPIIIIISRETFHPLFLISRNMRVYLLIFCCQMCSSKKQSFV